MHIRGAANNKMYLGRVLRNFEREDPAVLAVLRVPIQAT